MVYTVNLTQPMQLFTIKSMAFKILLQLDWYSISPTMDAAFF